mmetsp:Transcript_13569/g.57441  ORF Transcript_13569/g.57441 Transcript_13569/m.57441 type:complete len:267 (+) Transcript_13569:814-1614(+)
MLATTQSTVPSQSAGKSSSSEPSARKSARRESSTPLSFAFLRADFTLSGSTSTPVAFAAPMSSAPMASTPDPVPKSTTCLPRTHTSALSLSQPRHSLVVGCSPVPNASPGSRTTDMPSSSPAGSVLAHSGTIHSPSPTLIGTNESITTLTQSLSGIVSTTYSIAFTPRMSTASAMTASMSTPDANMAVTSQLCHTSSSPAYSSVSRSVPRSASSTLQQVAPRERRTSCSSPTFDPSTRVMRTWSTLPPPRFASMVPSGFSVEASLV